MRTGALDLPLAAAVALWLCRARGSLCKSRTSRKTVDSFHCVGPLAAVMSTALCCASSTSNSSPPHILRGSFFRVCSCHGSLRRLTPATGRVRLPMQNANSCSCASSTCAIASKSHRIASGTWTRRLCALSHQASAGGPKKKPSQPRLRHGHTCCKHERRQQVKNNLRS